MQRIRFWEGLRWYEKSYDKNFSIVGSLRLKSREFSADGKLAEYGIFSGTTDLAAASSRQFPNM